MLDSNPLPREIASGVFWLGDCLEQQYQGRAYHSYNAAFLVCGSEASMCVAAKPRCWSRPDTPRTSRRSNAR